MLAFAAYCCLPLLLLLFAVAVCWLLAIALLAAARGLHVLERKREPFAIQSRSSILFINPTVCLCAFLGDLIYQVQKQTYYAKSSCRLVRKFTLIFDLP